MKRKNNQEKILKIIKSKPRGTIFIYSDFLDIAETNTLRKAFKRLVDAKEITRVFDGMFAILEYSDILKRKIYPSPTLIAKTMARKFKWEIYPSGNTALNIVGLSTQVPNNYEYLSDGPYRKYKYKNITINFKNTVNKKLKIGSDELVTLVSAIDHIGKSSIQDKELSIIKQYIDNNIKTDKLLNKTKALPEWIYNLLKKIFKELNKNDKHRKLKH